MTPIGRPVGGKTVPKGVRAIGSPQYICNDENILFELVKKKVELRKAEAISNSRDIVYAKAKYLEEEIMSENPPQKVVMFNPIYRKQIITKSCKLLGFVKQGKHSSKALLILRLV